MNDIEIIEDEEAIHTFKVDGKEYSEFSIGVREDSSYAFYRDGIELETNGSLDVDETDIFNHLVNNILI